MRETLTQAKLPLPNFRSDTEVAEYFDTHSVGDIWDQLPEVKSVKLPLKKIIRKKQRI